MPTEIAEPNKPRPLERRVGLGKRSPAAARRLRQRRPRVVQPVGRDRAAAAPIPRLEEALEDFVDEAPARARRQRGLVFGQLVESQHVGREELERAVLVALERAHRICRRQHAADVSAAGNRIGRSFDVGAWPHPAHCIRQARQPSYSKMRGRAARRLTDPPPDPTPCESRRRASKARRSTSCSSENVETPASRKAGAAGR